MFLCEGSADKLANLALIHREEYKWFNVLTSCIYLNFFRNKYSLSLFREM